VTGGDVRAILEAELILMRLARGKGGPCQCASRSRLALIWDGVPTADPNPCAACGWVPLVVEVVYGVEPLPLGTP
jgi:hypothetical protein